MTLVTLSGTISAADLNTNFSDKTATINANILLGKKDYQYDLEAYDVVTSGAALQTLDFTPPDDLELRVMGLFVSSASAAPLITLTLSAIDIDANAAPEYLLDQTVAVSVQAVVGQVNATRDDRQATSTTKIFLKKGVTYRMLITSSSATPADYVQAFVYTRTRRRRS